MKRYIKARKQGHDKNLVQQACMSTLETQEKIWQKKKKKSRMTRRDYSLLLGQF